jgi:hypothetical protein
VTCAIGEGIKDEAPGIFVGEQLGTWRPGSPAVTIARRSDRRHDADGEGAAGCD